MPTTTNTPVLDYIRTHHPEVLDRPMTYIEDTEVNIPSPEHLRFTVPEPQRVFWDTEATPPQWVEPQVTGWDVPGVEVRWAVMRSQVGERPEWVHAFTRRTAALGMVGMMNARVGGTWHYYVAKETTHKRAWVDQRDMQRWQVTENEMDGRVPFYIETARVATNGWLDGTFAGATIETDEDRAVVQVFTNPEGH